MAAGTAFVAEIPDGPTAIVLLGRGRLRFAPPDQAERTQIRLFTGADDLQSEFDAAFVRLRPSDFESKFRAESLVPRAVVPTDLRRATEVFEEYLSRTLQIDLTDLSRDRWSLVPSSGDLIAEVRTRRFGSLTYARSGNEAEDITVFDRRRRRNISLYASAEKLATRGRFYSEDDLVDYDVLAYEVDTTFAPERYWINGTAHLRVRVRAGAMTTMTLKLAEAFAVRGVYAPGFGRLLHLRVVNQNSLIVNLPTPVFRDNEFTLTIVYSGRLEPSELDREAVDVRARSSRSASRHRYRSSRDTSTATTRSGIRSRPSATTRSARCGSRCRPSSTSWRRARSPVRPKPASAASSGAVRAAEDVRLPERSARPLPLVRRQPHVAGGLDAAADQGLDGGLRRSPRRRPRSVAARIPLRPLASVSVAEPSAAAGAAREEGSVTLTVKANPRQMGRARSLAEQASAILQFYASIVGEAPYPTFTLAVTENELPGGHSPAYFAVLNQVLPTPPIIWRNDPVNFETFPAFYLAHELAHQWWGQAVGWKNYHEQWLSEGFAQYFAALYAEKALDSNVFPSVLRQMRRSGIDTSPQGPIYLGYRLGHIRGERPVFRSLVYNKSAIVLHMLRRLVGDDQFFFGVRRFYAEWRFKKAGTDDFRVAMEAATGRDLGPFFEAWIFGVTIPRVAFSYRSLDANSIAVKFEQRGDVAPVPDHGDADLHERRDRIGRRAGDRTGRRANTAGQGHTAKSGSERRQRGAGGDREAGVVETALGFRLSALGKTFELLTRRSCLEPKAESLEPIATASRSPRLGLRRSARTARRRG